MLNYDAPDDRWPAELKAAFERYVTDGGGLVIVHAADNAFPGWKAFNEMIGVGGWRDRTEKAGPFWFFKDGKLTSDTSPGRAGSHGQRLPFKVTVRDPNHPITQGLPGVWMHQGDELYATLRGPGRNMTVLATAHSDPSNNGTGRDEPQLMVLSYGKGRVFHTTMGHDVSALSSVDFVATFQRGTEWAATGAVTQKIPADFPTADTRVQRPAAIDHRRRWTAAPAAAPAGGRGSQASPASVPPPATATPQTYPPEQVRAGQPIFAAQCGFCHGRDAMGGETGPDLTRAPMRRRGRARRQDRAGACAAGRVDKGMPAFTPQRRGPRRRRRVHSRPEDEGGVADGRPPRASTSRDLQTGNADAGKTLLRPAPARDVIPPTGDLAGLAKRLKGLPLLQRMLYPNAGGGASRPARKVTVTLPSGETVAGHARLSRRVHDRAHRLPSGAYRSCPTHQVKFTVDDPLQAHVEQLGKYTDDDMHNVLAYLQTLR